MAAIRRLKRKTETFTDGFHSQTVNVELELEDCKEHTSTRAEGADPRVWGWPWPAYACPAPPQ